MTWVNRGSLGSRDVVDDDHCKRCIKTHSRRSGTECSATCNGIHEGVVRGKLVLNLFIRSSRERGKGLGGRGRRSQTARERSARCTGDAIIISLLLYNWRTAVNETSWDGRTIQRDALENHLFIYRSFNWRQLAWDGWRENSPRTCLLAEFHLYLCTRGIYNNSLSDLQMPSKN